MAQKKIGKYTIIKAIQQGGMGKIYLAKLRGQKENVILKKLMLNRADIKKRFEREASLMQMFKHPNIVKVIDNFKSGSSLYIAMEFIDGVSLEKLIGIKTCIDPIAGILIFQQVCLGLQYAHKKSVVHRDIKPANVLIHKNGKVKLTDFGIATPGEKKERERLTKTGMQIGTPAYMSPEQLISSKHVDAQSDIYSMGVMLYEMMTGKKAFKSTFSGSNVLNICEGNYIKPERHNPKIPSKIRSIIKKAMDCKKRNRYGNMEELLKALNPFLKKFKEKKEIAKHIKSYLASKKSK